MSDPTQDWRRQRLLDAVNQKYEGNKAALGRALGYKDGAFVGQMLRGERPVKEDTILKIESLTGLNGWFSLPITAKAQLKLVSSAQQDFVDRAAMGTNGSPAEVPLEDNQEYPTVPLVKFKLAAGASGFGVEYLDNTAKPMVFHRDWYAVNGYDPRKMFAVMVSGESMEPGLYGGDAVVVNTADTAPIDATVYAVNYEGELVIKRLVRDEGAWWLVSDNPDQRRFPRKRVHEGTFIIGRVVHKQSERI
jgi:phage repressor protein C with HTH and peptisase S24 domain